MSETAGGANNLSTSSEDNNSNTSSSTANSDSNKSAEICGIATKTKVKIIIIGAGMAGLSAANHLLSNGCDDFCILEGRSRIGGRIVSIPLTTQRVELGANWIHGVLGNPMFEIAVQNGLVSVVNIPKPHRIVATTENGHQVPFNVLQEIYEAYVCFLRRCDEYFLCQYSPPPDIHSVGEHINYEIEIYLSSVQEPKEKRLKQSIFNCLLKRETCITGCDNMNEVDLLELGSYTELQGGNIVLPNGYSSILQPISSQIPKEKIITKCPVKKIRWRRKKTLTGLETVDEHSENEGDDEDDDDDDDDSDASQKTVTEIPTAGSLAAAACAAASTVIASTVNPSNTESLAQQREGSADSEASSSSDDIKDSPIRIICDDGRTFYAEHVICTIPLGVLKQNHKTIFEPLLPQYKRESIDNLMFGTVDKIYLEYERPFLSADISEIMLLWDDDKYELNTTVEERSSVEYLSKNWFKKIYSFAKVSDTLLLGWVSGREAEYMETLTHDVIAEKCTEILRNFLQDPYVPKPKLCVCTSWKSQPFTCGSYTSIPVGATQEDIENLAQPVYASPQAIKPAIVFAGEHTHSSFYSTVHGAYLSGRTAAQTLLTNEQPEEIILEAESTDLSSWIRGISLE